MDRKHKIIGLTLSILVLFQLTVGTSPTPPPYHEYLVRGTISRSSGLRLDNFVVLLRGKFHYSVPDSLVPIIAGRAENERYPGVTDSSGRFVIVVATGYKADSLAVEVTAADKDTVRGPVVAVPQQGIALTTDFTETEPGCYGCTSKASKGTKIVGYQYYLPEQTISLPF